MTYCSIQRIRLLTDLKSEDAGDAELRDLRNEVAVPKLNDDINQDVKDEQLDHVSSSKDNIIDGSNKTFYLEQTHRSFKQVGDLNDDAQVDASDIEVYYIDGDDNRVYPNVTSLEDADIGQFKMEKQNGDALKADEVSEGPFVTYTVAPTDVSSPSRGVENACAYLTGALGYSNINAGNFNNFSVGAISVDDSDDGEAADQLMKYQSTIERISQSELLQADENRNNIEGVFSNGVRR